MRRAARDAQGAGGLGGGRMSAAGTTALQLALFAALGTFAALHWTSLVQSPPTGRILLAVAVLTAAGAGMGALDGPGWPAPAGAAGARWS